MEREHYLTLKKIQDSHWFYRYRRDFLRRAIAEALPDSQSLEILDYGAGTGANLEALAPFGNVTCVEPEPVAIPFLRDSGRAKEVIQGDADGLHSRSDLKGRFDLILVSYVLYHRDVEEPAATLKILSDFAKPGAVIINLEPAFESLRRAHDWWGHGLRRFTGASLKELHQGSGWNPVSVSYLLPSLFPIGWALSKFDHGSGKASRERPTIEHGIAALPLANLLASVWVNSVDAALRKLSPPFGVSVCVVSNKS